MRVDQNKESIELLLTIAVGDREGDDRRREGEARRSPCFDGQLIYQLSAPEGSLHPHSVSVGITNIRTRRVNL